MNKNLTLIVPMKTTLKVVPIVICFDNNYSIGGAGVVSSICQNMRADHFYDIIIFEDHISEKNKFNLLSIVSQFTNFSLRFFSFDNLENIHLAPSVSYFSTAAYARLFIPTVMSSYDKVIYIDSDMIVNGDVTPLLDMDLKGKSVAAVVDFQLMNEHYEPPFLFKGNKIPARDYLKNIIGLKEVEKYFNSGLLILDNQVLRRDGDDVALIQEISKDIYTYPDQDILNKVLMDKVLYLPLEWNMFSQDLRRPIANKKMKAEYVHARKEPKIVHYAGSRKPWKYPDVALIDYYANAIKSTPWNADFQKVYDLKLLCVKGFFKKNYHACFPAWTLHSYFGKAILRVIKKPFMFMKKLKGN